ncbi:hypothetical protein ACVWVZ_005458 [Pseudomonas tolaasii]
MSEILRICIHPSAKYYRGESLSSWCYRLCQYPEVQMHLLERYKRNSIYPASYSSIFEFEQDLSPGADLDFVACLQTKSALQSMIGGYLKKFQLPASQVHPIIPWSYRRSYCYSCMAEAMGTTKAPILKIRWRRVCEPFCDRHKKLLMDAPLYVGRPLDAPRTIFKWHHSGVANNIRHNEYLDQWSEVLRIAYKIQKKIHKIRTGNDAKLVKLFDDSIMSLFRALLTPQSFLYQHSGARRLLDVFSREGESKNVALYLQPYRASSASRARALFYIGLLIGWIRNSEATLALSDDFWAPKTSEDVWEAIYRSDSKVCSTTLMNLRLFKSDLLNFATPNLVRFT